MEVAALALDAARTNRRFGEHAISVFGALDEDAVEEAARGVLCRYEVLTLTTARAIRLAGLELRPRFRRPHYSVMLADLTDGLNRLLTCQTLERPNPHHLPPEAPP